MATFKVVILTNKQNQRNDGLFNVKIRIQHGGQAKYLITEFNIRKRQIKDGAIINHPSAERINYVLQSEINKHRRTLLNHNTTSLSVTDLARLLSFADGEGINFYKYAENRIKDLQGQGKTKTAETYTGAINRLKLQARQLNFADITLPFLTRFEANMKKELGATTISIYMRAIRAIFNRAIDDGLVPINLYPFRKFKIKKGDSKRRNLTMQQLITLRDVELTADEAFARDMFMLIFYLIGINFKDLFYITRIDRGRIYYRRAKTGKLYSVLVPPEALHIIDRYRGDEKLIRKFQRNKDLKKHLKRINSKLRLIGHSEKVKFDFSLTTYYARHTWATLAIQNGIAKDIVSLALGHTFGNTTTENYIEYDMRVVDEANRKLLDLLC